MDIVTILATIALEFLITTALVGIVFFSLLGSKESFIKSKKALLVLVLIFAVYDLYWMPALLSLDATLFVGNSRVVELAGTDQVKLIELMGVGWVEVIIWMVQALVAYYIGREVYRRYIANQVEAGL